MNRFIVTLGIVAVCVAGAACSSPAVRFYALPTPPPTDAAADATVTVMVGPVRIPKHLNRPNIGWREGPTRISYDDNNRWGSTFEAEVLRATTEHLSADLPQARVVSWPAQAVGEGAIQIVIEVQQLDASADGPAYLRARYVARRGTQAEVVVEAVATVRGEMAGDDASDAVAAYATLVKGMADEIARGVAGAL